MPRPGTANPDRGKRLSMIRITYTVAAVNHLSAASMLTGGGC
jgi:hypothetical protein